MLHVTHALLLHVCGGLAAPATKTILKILIEKFPDKIILFLKKKEKTEKETEKKKMETEKEFF